MLKRRGLTVVYLRLCFASLVLLTSCTRTPQSAQSENSARLSKLAFKDLLGKRYLLSDIANQKSSATVFVFLGTQCPVGNKYIPRLNELYEQFKNKGVRFFGVYPNEKDELMNIAEHVRDYHIHFPVVKDWDQQISTAVDAERLSQAVLLDSRLAIRYSGQIDDQYGIEATRSHPSRDDLSLGIQQTLAGDAVERPRTSASGCLLTKLARREIASDLTYVRDVAPMIHKNCLGCHTGGGIAPFSLAGYDEIKAWSAMIREVVREQRMPPWHANSSVTKYANDRSLSEEDRTRLLNWIDSGAKRGEAAANAGAEAKGHASQSLGRPDRILVTAKPVQVPASGASYFEELVFDPHFDKDTWIRAVEIKPGNTSVVHHITAYVIRADHAVGEDGVGSDRADWGYFAAFTPGGSPMNYPEGYAKLIPAHGKIILNIHYTPRGKPETDESSVNLYFAHSKVLHRVHTMPVRNITFSIPPHAKDVPVHAERAVASDLKVLSVMPHAHYRGRSFNLAVRYPSGERKKLLSVPRYDFNWQYEYKLASPLAVPRGSTFECDATFDNSEDNPANPDPAKTVSFGVDSTDEMMFCYVDFITTQ
ncbi:MAG: redoxin domain-containing protein [Deltaproteobacteria bacterium]|nr:redoxin domain-containing protein [Deltaproteobacteria bacterium]